MCSIIWYKALLHFTHLGHAHSGTFQKMPAFLHHHCLFAACHIQNPSLRTNAAPPNPFVHDERKLKSHLDPGSQHSKPQVMHMHNL